MNSRGLKLLSILLATVGALVLLPGSAGAALTFKPAVGFDVGTSPSAVASGDFDADGYLDLAVANFGTDSVSVLPGNGSGGFGAALEWPVGDSPRGTRVADFDGDGYPDIATANANSDDVSILLNSGGGTFGAPLTLDTGAAPFSLATGDFNGDGYPDIAVANSGASSVTVLPGLGNAAFGQPITASVGASPFAIRVADFNNDGQPDIATANADADTVSILLNQGSQGGGSPFAAATSFPVGDGPFGITGADFNGDGRPDLATANSGAGNVSILLGLAGGTFSAPIPFASGQAPYDLTSGDFDGDRKADLAVANFGSDEIAVLPGLGNGSFGNALKSGAGNGPFAIGRGDFNGDGAPDLATPLLDANDVSVLLNAPTAAQSDLSFGFGAPVPVPKGTLSGPRVLTITNGGSAPLRIDGFTFAGDFPGDFMVETDSCKAIVRPGDNCRVRVRFVPNGIGIRSATLTVQTNAATNPTVALSGQAGPAPRAEVTCRITGRKPRNVKITCRVTYPSSTLSARAPWRLSRSGEIVRRGTVAVRDSRASLDLRNLGSLRKGSYLLEVDGERAATFRIDGR